MNFPKRVTIELTNRCNRSCQGCPRLKTTYPLGDMDWELFKNIVWELPKETVVVPFFRGEPLLYPTFTHAMDELHKFHEVQLASNGDYLNHDNLKAILRTCTFFSLSLHELRILPTLREMQLLNQLKKTAVITQVSILESLLPIQNKQIFIKNWRIYVDRVRIYHEHSHIGFGDTNLNIEDNGDPCSKLFSDLAIYWDGKTALCNHDWQNHNPIGDVNHQSISEIWSTQTYQNIRNMHNQGKRRSIPSCQNCDYWSKQTFGEIYT